MQTTGKFTITQFKAHLSSFTRYLQKRKKELTYSLSPCSKFSVFLIESWQQKRAALGTLHEMRASIVWCRDRGRQARTSVNSAQSQLKHKELILSCMCSQACSPVSYVPPDSIGPHIQIPFTSSRCHHQYLFVYDEILCLLTQARLGEDRVC